MRNIKYAPEQCNSVSVEALIRDAASKTHEAYEQSECKLCARQLDTVSGILNQMADLYPLTSKTAREAQRLGVTKLREIGGKTALLTKLAAQATQNPDGNGTSDQKGFYTLQQDGISRGLFMEKHRATLYIGGAVGVGAGVGFVLNRLDRMLTPNAVWYMRLAPAADVLGGLALAVLGMMGKPFKGEKARTVMVAGGSAMMAIGALQYLEGLYSQMGGTSSRAPARYVNARAPGQLPMRIVETTRSY